MNYNNDYELSEYAQERQWDVSAAFPVLMRKVYVWMTLALVITGITAYGVANSPGILQAIYNNQILFWGLIIAEFALVIGVSAAINKPVIVCGNFDVCGIFGHQWRITVVYFPCLYQQALLLLCSSSRQEPLRQWLSSVIPPRPTCRPWVSIC